MSEKRLVSQARWLGIRNRCVIIQSKVIIGSTEGCEDVEQVEAVGNKEIWLACPIITMSYETTIAEPLAVRDAASDRLTDYASIESNLPSTPGNEENLEKPTTSNDGQPHSLNIHTNKPVQDCPPNTVCRRI